MDTESFSHLLLYSIDWTSSKVAKVSYGYFISPRSHTGCWSSVRIFKLKSISFRFSREMIRICTDITLEILFLSTVKQQNIVPYLAFVRTRIINWKWNFWINYLTVCSDGLIGFPFMPWRIPNSLAAMFVYDIFLTFPLEVEKVWKRRITGLTVLWFLVCSLLEILPFCYNVNSSDSLMNYLLFIRTDGFMDLRTFLS